MKSGLYKKYIGSPCKKNGIDPSFDKDFNKLQAINKAKDVDLGTITNKRIDFGENPIREADKVKHPRYAEAMKNINTYSKMEGGPEADDYFEENIRKPAIRYNDKTYSLQALISD